MVWQKAWKPLGAMNNFVFCGMAKAWKPLGAMNNFVFCGMAKSVETPRGKDMQSTYANIKDAKFSHSRIFSDILGYFRI